MQLEIMNLDQFQTSQYEETLSWLTDQRRNSINRIASHDDRKRSVCGEYLARKMITQELKIRSKEIQFVYGKTGKPDRKDIKFSITHSDNIVACVTDQNPVGIDVESIERMNLVLADICCTELERQKLDQLPPDEKKAYLLYLWVLKEATVKCLGQDLTKIQDYEFQVYQRKLINCQNPLMEYRVHQLGDGYLLAICRQKSELEK